MASKPICTACSNLILHSSPLAQHPSFTHLPSLQFPKHPKRVPPQGFTTYSFPWLRCYSPRQPQRSMPPFHISTAITSPERSSQATLPKIRTSNPDYLSLSPHPASSFYEAHHCLPSSSLEHRLHVDMGFVLFTNLFPGSRLVPGIQ